MVDTAPVSTVTITGIQWDIMNETIIMFVDEVSHHHFLAKPLIFLAARVIWEQVFEASHAISIVLR